MGYDVSPAYAAVPAAVLAPAANMANKKNRNAVIHLRVTEDTKLLLVGIADHLRNDLTGALEFLIHDFARARGVIPADRSRLNEGGAGRTASGASLTAESAPVYDPHAGSSSPGGEGSSSG